VTKINKELFNRRIEEAYEALEEIREITGMRLDDFMKSRRARFSLRYSIVLLVEALADLAVAILEKDFGVVSESYRDAFFGLSEKGVVGAETVQSMIGLVALRNMIVHRYWKVDDTRIYDVARKNGIGVVEKFISEVSRYVEAKDP